MKNDIFDILVKFFDIKKLVINESNCYKFYYLFINNEFGYVIVQLDGDLVFWIGVEVKEKFGFQLMFLLLVEGVIVQLNLFGYNYDYIIYGMFNDIGVVVDVGIKVIVDNLLVVNMYIFYSVLFEGSQYIFEFVEKFG